MAIPRWLDWHSPPYGHQKAAIDSLENAAGSGILAIATGGGKTRTALIAATRRQNLGDEPVLIVVLVPSRPLALQWVEAVREFDINPVLLSGPSPEARERLLSDIAASLQGKS